MLAGRSLGLMEKLVGKLAVFSAMSGGVALLALVLMTCASILGRAFSFAGLGPVKGDFELLEAGIAFCIFAFLPICQLKAAHATVDVFTSPLSAKINRLLVALWEIVFALVMALIAWRLYEGMLTKLQNGETTFLIQFPVWWAYAASLVPAIAAVLVSFWSAWDRARAVATSRDTRPLSGEGSH
jgi:TRAP-type C4-dicarboxylate transport system permease small subunit